MYEAVPCACTLQTCKWCTAYGVRTCTQRTNVKGYKGLFQQLCMVPHTTLLTFDPNPGLWRVGIPFTDHCELFIQRSEWMVCTVITCIILKHCCTCTVVPCWWWCEPVHMPIMTSAVYICCLAPIQLTHTVQFWNQNTLRSWPHM